MHIERPIRAPTWIAGISIFSVCLMVASGIVAIVRSIPTSYANIPGEGASSQWGAVLSRTEQALSNGEQARLAAARPTINHRRWSCPECGVVDSMREIVYPGDVNGQNVGDNKFAGDSSVAASGSAMAAIAAKTKRYEFTVRFRDGSTTVFNEATPRTWQVGSRVIVIIPSNPSNAL